MPRGLFECSAISQSSTLTAWLAFRQRAMHPVWCGSVKPWLQHDVETCPRGPAHSLSSGRRPHQSRPWIGMQIEQSASMPSVAPKPPDLSGPRASVTAEKLGRHSC